MVDDSGIGPHGRVCQGGYALLYRGRQNPRGKGARSFAPTCPQNGRSPLRQPKWAAAHFGCKWGWSKGSSHLMDARAEQVRVRVSGSASCPLMPMAAWPIRERAMPQNHLLHACTVATAPNFSCYGICEPCFVSYGAAHRWSLGPPRHHFSFPPSLDYGTLPCSPLTASPVNWLDGPCLASCSVYLGSTAAPDT